MDKSNQTGNVERAMGYKDGSFSENQGSIEKPAEEAKLPYLANVKPEQKGTDELGFNFNELNAGFLSKGMEEQMSMPNLSVVGTMPRHANLYEFTGYTSLDYDTIANQSAQIYSNYVGNQYNNYYAGEAPEVPQVAPGEYIVGDSYMSSTGFNGSGSFNCFPKEEQKVDEELDNAEYVPHKSRRRSRRASTTPTQVGGKRVAKKGKRSDAEEEARRQNHNEIERKRREHISNLLHRLHNLLPALNKSNKGNYHAPSSKTAILTRACAYFEELNKVHGQGEQQVNQVEKPEEMATVDAGAYFLDGNQRK